MIRVLFVCLGNICRSPMAEALFRHKVREAGLSDRIEVDSAGTGDWHIGKPPHEGTQRLLGQRGIDAGGLRARQVVREDYDQFDYIVAMDDSNLGNLERIFANQAAAGARQPRIVKMLAYGPALADTNVPDPYYTGNFEAVYDLLDAACEQLLEEIQREGFKN